MTWLLWMKIGPIPSMGRVWYILPTRFGGFLWYMEVNIPKMDAIGFLIGRFIEQNMGTIREATFFQVGVDDCGG